MLEGKLQSIKVNYTHEKGINNLSHTHTNTHKITGINKHCSLISPNINGLNSPNKMTNRMGSIIGSIFLLYPRNIPQHQG